MKLSALTEISILFILSFKQFLSKKIIIFYLYLSGYVLRYHIFYFIFYWFINWFFLIYVLTLIF